MATSYTFCELLGHGGMGEAYLAVQKGFGGFEKLIVVKRMAPYSRRDDVLTELFTREARLAACIRHPNVVAVLDIKRTGRELFIMMEYIAGLTFRDVLSRGAPPIPVACKALADVAAGLHAGHHAVVKGEPTAIIHGDVSPPNLMLGFDGTAKVLDFGIAQVVRSHEESEGTALCKMAYVAPEQVMGRPIGPWTDIWQLGVVAHEMLTGSHPFPTDRARAEAARGERRCETLRAVRPDLPEPVDLLVQAMLSPEASDRPTGEQVHKTLATFAFELGRQADGGAAEWLQQTFSQVWARRRDVEARAVAGELENGEFRYLSQLLDPGASQSISLDVLHSSSAAEPEARRPSMVVPLAVAVLALAVALMPLFGPRASVDPKPTPASSTQGASGGPREKVSRLDGLPPPEGAPPTEPPQATDAVAEPVPPPQARTGPPPSTTPDPASTRGSGQVPPPPATSTPPEGPSPSEAPVQEPDSDPVEETGSAPFPPLPRTDNIDPWAN